MRFTTPTTRKLAELYKEIVILGKIQALLSWDLNVNLPKRASSDRAEQSAYLTGLSVDRWQNTEFRNVYEKAQTINRKLTSEEQAMIRNIGWAGKYYWKVPKALVVEFSKATSEAFVVWSNARKENDFSLFAPYLKTNIKLSQDIADHLGYFDNRYDALLDEYEMGLTAKECKRIFSLLRKNLKPIIKKLGKKNEHIEEKYIGLNNFYSPKRQRQLSDFILKKMGYDWSSGRLDTSPHPFTSDLSRYDVRITTRYIPNDFRSSFSATIHEAGHALYELGVNEIFDKTPLSGGVSLGIHESQSRFWENQIGRNREFLRFMTPIFQAFYPEHLENVTEADIFSLFNTVKPNYIRIEADEVTYNMHIMLRFDLEEQLINEKLSVDDLPEVWRTGMKEYLGITPYSDCEGVLQDVHWSYGNFGYFPTYTLGNLYAAQFTEKLKKELPLDSLVGQGNFGTILSWLRQNIHQYGSLYWPNELVTKVTGEPLNPQYFIKYIQEKYLSY